jgi:hypothetical protein
MYTYLWQINTFFPSKPKMPYYFHNIFQFIFFLYNANIFLKKKISHEHNYYNKLTSTIWKIIEANLAHVTFLANKVLLAWTLTTTNLTNISHCTIYITVTWYTVWVTIVTNCATRIIESQILVFILLLCIDWLKFHLPFFVCTSIFKTILV